MLGKVNLPARVDIPGQNGVNKPMFINPQNNQITTRDNAFQGFDYLKNQAYDRVYSHELQHQQAGGDQAGSIHIDYDNNGVAMSGHVNIQVPTAVDKSNASETAKRAEVAHKAAMAPSDPSGADLAVAAQASSIQNQALSLMGKTNTPKGQKENQQTEHNDNKANKLNYIC